MIEADCAKCGKEIIEKAALLYSEPNDDEMCKKTHLCRKCYKEILEIIYGTGSSR